jgi:phage terminase small subunit
MLTAKQQRFVEAFLVNPNGTRAAVQAGYSPKTARFIASENLRKPVIFTAIAKAKAQQLARDESSIKKVREELALIGFANLKDIFDANGDILEPARWPHHLQGMVNYSKRKRVRRTRDGEITREVTHISVNLSKKLKALQILGKSLGMFPPSGRRRR